MKNHWSTVRSTWCEQRAVDFTLHCVLFLTLVNPAAIELMNKHFINFPPSGHTHTTPCLVFYPQLLISPITHTSSLLVSFLLIRPHPFLRHFISRCAMNLEILDGAGAYPKQTADYSIK